MPLKINIYDQGGQGPGHGPPRVGNTRASQNEVCLCCGKTGHAKAVCRKKDARCDVCDKMGHLSYMCRAGGGKQEARLGSPRLGSPRLASPRFGSLRQHDKWLLRLKIVRAETESDWTLGSKDPEVTEYHLEWTDRGRQNKRVVVPRKLGWQIVLALGR